MWVSGDLRALSVIKSFHRLHARRALLNEGGFRVDKLSKLRRDVDVNCHLFRLFCLDLILSGFSVNDVVGVRDIARFLSHFRGHLLMIRLNGLFFHF